MKHIPAIKTVMTAFPWAIDIEADIGEARAMMLEHGIRHLPIKQDGELVAVLSERDIHVALGQDGSGDAARPVREHCIRDAYIVQMDEPLDNVVLHMAANHLGSALVVRDGKLAGIFTTTDACTFLGDHLREQFRPPGGNDAA